MNNSLCSSIMKCFTQWWIQRCWPLHRLGCACQVLNIFLSLCGRDPLVIQVPAGAVDGPVYRPVNHGPAEAVVLQDTAVTHHRHRMGNYHIVCWQLSAMDGCGLLPLHHPVSWVESWPIYWKSWGMQQLNMWGLIWVDSTLEICSIWNWAATPCPGTGSVARLVPPLALTTHRVTHLSTMSLQIVNQRNTVTLVTVVTGPGCGVVTLERAEDGNTANTPDRDAHNAANTDNTDNMDQLSIPRSGDLMATHSLPLYCVHKQHL